MDSCKAGLIDVILKIFIFSMLVVATSGTGYILGSGSSIDYLGLCCTCAGTMMVAASANSLNQVPRRLVLSFFTFAVTYAPSITILGTVSTLSYFMKISHQAW